MLHYLYANPSYEREVAYLEVPESFYEYSESVQWVICEESGLKWLYVLQAETTKTQEYIFESGHQNEKFKSRPLNNVQLAVLNITASEANKKGNLNTHLGVLLK